MLNVLDLSWNMLLLQNRKRTILLILQGKSISFPTRRIVVMFYPSFAFKCSVIQQRYGSISRSTCSLDFKLTWIQTATNLCCGYNQRRAPETYRRQDDVFAWLRNAEFTVWSAASFSESELQTTEKTIWCTTQPTKSSKYVCMSMHLRSLRYPINFSLQHYVAVALASRRSATVRFSIHD